jgi:hypothetical protein
MSPLRQQTPAWIDSLSLAGQWKSEVNSCIHRSNICGAFCEPKSALLCAVSEAALQYIGSFVCCLRGSFTVYRIFFILSRRQFYSISALLYISDMQIDGRDFYTNQINPPTLVSLCFITSSYPLSIPLLFTS